MRQRAVGETHARRTGRERRSWLGALPETAYSAPNPAINRGIYEARANNQKFFKEATEIVCYSTHRFSGLTSAIEMMHDRCWKTCCEVDRRGYYMVCRWCQWTAAFQCRCSHA